jgi:sugar phosphate isomerase/epimerase
MQPDWIKSLPFRLGTTSYIIPDEILPNVRFLAGQVRDIELIFFELDDGLNNLPDESNLSELRRIGADHDLSFTVHLPLDLDLGAAGAEREKTLGKAQRVISTVDSLNPWAYVLHLDGAGLRQNLHTDAASAWLERAAQTLEILSRWAGSSDRLAVENLDGYPADFSQPLVEMLTTSQCVDIGHLWKDRVDPIPYLKARLPHTRVIHLHGIGERDHQSLAHMAAHQVDDVIGLLISTPYTGVATLEVFSESDLSGSLHTIQGSLSRLSCK